MRIVFLVSHFPPEYIGGTEIQTSRLAKHLSSKHEVTILTRNWLRNLPEFEKRDGYTIKRFKIVNIPVLRFFSHIIFSLNEIRKMRKEIDVLQCMMLTPNGLVGILTKKLFGISVVTWIRGGDWYFAKEKFIKKKIIAYILRNSDLVFAQTKKIKAEVLSEFPETPIEILPNGVDIAEEKAAGDKIVFAGNLIRRKGVEYLVEAMGEVDGKLLIVGDGSERKKLEEKSRGMDIEFVGKVAPEKVRDYMRQGKIFVLPAIRGEGLPNVILEAMSLGLPVIATKLAGIPDTVEHGKTGFLVDPKDSESLAKYISLLLTDEGLWRKMRENCLEEIKKYSWENIVQQLGDIYIDLK